MGPTVTLGRRRPDLFSKTRKIASPAAGAASQGGGIVWYGQEVEARERGGPDHDAIVRYIRERYPDTFIATAMGATFFSCEESSWPNFATLVTTDEHDTTPVSNLARRGVFRLNISLRRERFAQLVGGPRNPDFAALDMLMPHPVYAPQHWRASSTRARRASTLSSSLSSTRLMRGSPEPRK